MEVAADTSVVGSAISAVLLATLAKSGAQMARLLGAVRSNC